MYSQIIMRVFGQSSQVKSDEMIQFASLRSGRWQRDEIILSTYGAWYQHNIGVPCVLESKIAFEIELEYFDIDAFFDSNFWFGHNNLMSYLDYLLRFSYWDLVIEI